MRSGSNSGPRWLDSIARFAVAGRSAAGSEKATAGPSIPASGTTRRTALRTAAGVGALALVAPSRLLDPSPAVAASTQLSECTSAKWSSAYDDFQACVKRPLEEFEEDVELLKRLEGYLREAKTPAARRRLKKNIKSVQSVRDRDLQDVEFCNATFVQDRNEGESYCQSHQPPSPKGPGCEAGYLLCGDYCCDTNYATCQGCSAGPTCCRIGGECCPGG